jgi:hypothetical protein
MWKNLGGKYIFFGGLALLVCAVHIIKLIYDAEKL